MLDTEVAQWPLNSCPSHMLQDSFHILTSSKPLLDRLNFLQPEPSTIPIPDWSSHFRDLSMNVDRKNKAFTRPAARSRKGTESRYREPKRKPSPVDDYDVCTIRPGKSKAQSTQDGKGQHRSHRQGYSGGGRIEVTEDSDDEFAHSAGRARPRTKQIHSERSPGPRHPPRRSHNDSHRSSNRDLSIEPLPRPARRDQPRRNQSSGRYRRDRDSSTDSYESPPPPRRRAKSSARHDRDRSRSLDYQRKPRTREYTRPVRDPPAYSAGLPRSATFPSQSSHSPGADHNFGPSSRSQTFPNLNGQFYNSTFVDPVFPSGGRCQSFSTSYTSPNGHQSYTTNTFGGSSPFNQTFFSGGSTPRTPRKNTAFFTERPGRTSQYDTYPQSSQNPYGPSWEGRAMDDILNEGDKLIDQAIERARRRMEQEKPWYARGGREPPRYDSTGPNHANNYHDKKSRYEPKYSDRHSREHGPDQKSGSHHQHHDYEHFQQQRERARSQARGHKPEQHTRAPSPVKEDPTHDYYVTLGVSPTATLEEVRAAAKKRRIATHPDRCKKPHMTEAEKTAIDEEAKRVGQAAVCLTDKTARLKYDYDCQMTKRFGNMRV